jgi:hypothetical protein
MSHADQIHLPGPRRSPTETVPHDDEEGSVDRGFLRWVAGSHPVRHLLLVVVLAVLGGLVGVLVARGLPVTYVSEARLAVGSESFAAQSVPGYSEASKTLASNYARYVVDTNAGAERLAREIGAPVGDIRLIQASPIADSNIVRIEVTATTPEVGDRAAAALARQLVEQINSPPAEIPDLRTSLEASARQVARLEARLGELSRQAQVARAARDAVETRRLSGVQVDVKTALSLATVQQQTASDQYRNALLVGTSEVSLQTVRQPTTVSDSGSTAVPWGGLVGAFGGAVLALLVLLLFFVRSRGRADPTQ